MRWISVAAATRDSTSAADIPSIARGNVSLMNSLAFYLRSPIASRARLFAPFFRTGPQRQYYGKQQEYSYHSQRIRDRDVQPRLGNQFYADEDQNQRQAGAQIAEIVQQAHQQEIKSSQSQDGEYVRRVNDERVAGNAKDRGDGINGKSHVGEFDDEQNEDQRRAEELPVLSHEEAGAVILLGEAEMFAGKAKNGVFFVVYGLFAPPEHVQARVHEKDAEGREDPVKPRDEHGADGNQQSAHDERAKDAPGQHTVLHAVVDVEGAKNHEKHEEIVDAQSLFDHVASEIFEAALLSIPVPDAATEGDGEADPQRAGNESFPDRDFVRIAVKNTQIKGQRN